MWRRPTNPSDGEPEGVPYMSHGLRLAACRSDVLADVVAVVISLPTPGPHTRAGAEVSNHRGCKLVATQR